jgi:hypothetical protein
MGLSTGTSTDPTAAPSSALDVGNGSVVDYLGEGLGKLLDTYVALDANAHNIQPANQATYKVPGTGQIVPVGSSGAVAGMSTTTILLLIAAGLAVFLVFNKK